MFAIVSLLIGVAAGTASRFVVLIPLIAAMGAMCVAHAMRAHLGFEGGAVDVLCVVVALNMGYLAGGLLSVRERARG